MNQTENFTMRISPLEKKMLKKLAKRLSRSQSDTVRLLIRSTLPALVKDEKYQGKEELDRDDRACRNIGLLVKKGKIP
jgi:hypothetical protein